MPNKPNTDYKDAIAYCNKVVFRLMSENEAVKKCLLRVSRLLEKGETNSNIGNVIDEVLNKIK